MGQRDEDPGRPRERPITAATEASVLVAPLGSFGTADIGRAGGKGANLGALVQRGYRVPDGFVVTTDAYAAVIQHAGSTSPLAAFEGTADGGPTDGSAIRSALLQTAVPEVLRRAISEAHAALGGGPVAVRSSATAEDLPGAAFAGQHDTFLNVVGEAELVDAVRRCWASLWTDRAITYRRRRGIPTRSLAIAVVVQRMVEAEEAGVMLTANPVTGVRDEILLDASSGLGEAVVSGIVTPDHYRLDSQDQVVEWRPGDREVVIRSVPGGGVVHDTESGVRATRLPDPVLGELARLGRGIAELFGRPQDIEWAHADGHVWVLQARPLTALPPPPQSLSRVQRRTGPVILEMLPSRPYPLDVSLWILPGLGRMVARMLDEIVGLRVHFGDVLPELDGVVDRFVPPEPRPTAAMVTRLPRTLRRARRYDSARWAADPRFAAYERRIDELTGRDLPSLTWTDLVAHAGEALDALDTMTDIRVDYLPHVGASQLRLLLALRVLGLTDLYADLVAGGATRTADANRALAELAALVRADDELRAAFLGMDADTLAERLQEPLFATFRPAVDAFLTEYGHRETTSVLLISAPTWSDSPGTLLGAVTSLVDEPPRLTRVVAGSAADRLLAHRLARSEWASRWIMRTVTAARSGIAMREDTHFHAARALPLLRRTALEVGRRLADVGILRDAEEVFHLRIEELQALPEPVTVDPADVARVHDVVEARAARRAELGGAPLISPTSLFHRTATDADALVTGTAAGGGRATGPVRLVRGPAEFGRLRSGDILVCPYTNPSWTSLFQRAAGVVVDTGGSASHAAIVAREFGIAAVMGTGTGTSMLVDGQMVTVDGDTGRVTAAPRP